MMPLVEDYLRDLLLQRLNWLKQNPDNIQRIFGTLGKRSTLKNLTNYVKTTDFKAFLGYPKEAHQVPCWVITLADEHEAVMGLGDCIDEDMPEDEDEENFHIDSIYMDATYRVEVWSDNEDLAVYMYILAKWAMMVSRKDMLEVGFVLPSVAGADLEPVPDYFPIFVYRRALMVHFQYENQFYDDEEMMEQCDRIIYKPNYYKQDIK